MNSRYLAQTKSYPHISLNNTSNTYFYSNEKLVLIRKELEHLDNKDIESLAATNIKDILSQKPQAKLLVSVIKEIILCTFQFPLYILINY